MRGVGHAQLLFQHQQRFGRLLLAGLEGIQPLFGVIGGQVRQLAQRACALQRLQRLLILNGAGLLHVERLLVVGQLALQLIHFQLGRFGARFIFGLLLAGLGHHFVLLFQTVGQLFQIGFIALDLPC